LLRGRKLILFGIEKLTASAEPLRRRTMTGAARNGRWVATPLRRQQRKVNGDLTTIVCSATQFRRAASVGMQSAARPILIRVVVASRVARSARFRSTVEGTRAMHTIALVSRKGGTGKSTLAIGLAVAAMEAGHRVRVLEADPLATISNWRTRRKEAEPIVERVRDGYEIVQRVRALAQRGITLTIIDTAGGWSEAWGGAVAAADLCLIPARPSLPDIEAAAPALAAIRADGKPFAFVINQTPVRSHRPESAAVSLGATAASLNMMGVLALPYIAQRNDQQDALAAGLAVTEFARDGKSAEEIRALWRWVWARLTSIAPDELQPPAEAPADAEPAEVAEDLPAVPLPPASAVDLYAAP
jgi:chromosome partitioning protein